MNTKLSNVVEYNNPYFAKEFAEFLIQNFFKCHTNNGYLYFVIPDKWHLAISFNDITVYKLVPKAITDEDKMKHVFSFTGLKHLNFFGFIQLMHVMGIVTLMAFVENAGQLSVQHQQEALQVVKQMALQTTSHA